MLLCAYREMQALRADVLQSRWDRGEENARKGNHGMATGIALVCVFRGSGGGHIGKCLTLNEGREDTGRDREQG